MLISGVGIAAFGKKKKVGARLQMAEKRSQSMEKEAKQEQRRRLIRLICIIVFVVSAVGLAEYGVSRFRQHQAAKEVQAALRNIRETEDIAAEEENDAAKEALGIEFLIRCEEPDEAEEAEEAAGIEFLIRCEESEILSQYRTLYELNPDMAGWLKIEGTVIDYPVMQTPEDEGYYLSRDFYGEESSSGCLIMDTDSHVGTGAKDEGYAKGQEPSTNLIIHGHTMRNGEMFGDLDLYKDETYGKEHSRICFDSLYEEREYELLAVFYSQVYYESDDVFKYYQFFQADTREEFEDWYGNIKKLSLYDTGVTAEFGDEFLTLSCCAYHVEDGRFVVVAKRI